MKTGNEVMSIIHAHYLWLMRRESRFNKILGLEWYSFSIVKIFKLCLTIVYVTQTSVSIGCHLSIESLKSPKNLKTKKSLCQQKAKAHVFY